MKDMERDRRERDGRGWEEALTGKSSANRSRTIPPLMAEPEKNHATYQVPFRAQFPIQCTLVVRLKLYLHSEDHSPGYAVS
jgi:hypothetical protein